MIARLLVGLYCLALFGCSDSSPPKPKLPSYKEALQIYNQELELLGRLKKEKNDAEVALQQKLTALKGAAAVEAVTGDLNKLAELAGGLGDLDNPDAEQKAKELAEKAKTQLSEGGAKAAADVEAVMKAHEAEMAPLKVKIAEQEAKVAKAEQVKNEAEKRQQNSSAPSSGY